MSPQLLDPTKSVWRLIRRFVPYVYGLRWRVAAVAGLLLLSPLIAVALLWLAKSLIDDVFIARNADLLPAFGIAYVILAIAKLLSDYLYARIQAGITEQISQNVRVDLFRHFISVSPGSLRKYSVGDLMTHLAGDAEWIEVLVYSGPLGLIFNVITAAFFVCLLLVLSWKLTLCALLIAPLLAILSWRLSPRVRRSARVVRHKTAAWMSRAEERLGATPVIHAFDTFASETATFAAQSSAARQAELRTIAVQARMTLLIDAVGVAGGLLVLGVGAHELFAGHLTIGALVAFIGSVSSLYSPINSLAKSTSQFQRAAASAQRVADLLDTPSLVLERPAAKELPRVRGVLEFSDVHFAYPDGAEVVHGVSFRADPGETLAIVGPNGSGKSTLIGLALRLYDPSAGTVSIDGIDLREVTLSSLRKSIAAVFQDPGVLRGTIGENIRYGFPGATDEAVTAMAQAARVHTFATALTRGYSAPVGPRGTWLSGGERQRLALARVFLRDAPVLLLDEATASVDSEAEELIQDALERLAGKRTLLLVSHRLSSVRRANRIIVMQNGRIVETGSFSELQRTGIHFRELFAAQLLAETVTA